MERGNYPRSTQWSHHVMIEQDHHLQELRGGFAKEGRRLTCEMSRRLATISLSLFDRSDAVAIQALGAHRCR